MKLEYCVNSILTKAYNGDDDDDASAAAAAAADDDDDDDDDGDDDGICERVQSLVIRLISAIFSEDTE